MAERNKKNNRAFYRAMRKPTNALGARLAVFFQKLGFDVTRVNFLCAIPTRPLVSFLKRNCFGIRMRSIKLELIATQFQATDDFTPMENPSKNACRDLLNGHNS